MSESKVTLDDLRAAKVREQAQSIKSEEELARISGNAEHLEVMTAVGPGNPTYWYHAARIYTPLRK